jgi:hypothetical protein
MLAGSLAVSPAKLKLAHGCKVERITGEALAACNRADLFKAALRAITQPNSDGAIEGDDGRRTQPYQGVVE